MQLLWLEWLGHRHHQGMFKWLSGYKIYWRLTDSNQWEKSAFVPTGTTEHTLENVVIDNYYFGVASVSKTGFESPVVFPGATGSFDRSTLSED